MPSKMVAVIVPLADRSELLPDEVISLRHLRRFLGRYDKFLVAPPGVDPRIEGFQAKKFPATYFGSVAAHNRLLGSRAFYRAFLDYEYIFFYHLDSLAFSDQLAEWCASGVDYIGPPWICCEDSPWVERPRVGNGGFTLLRVESALRVLTNRYLMKPETFWLDAFTAHSPRWLIRLLSRCEQVFPENRLVERLMREWRETEDPGRHNRHNDVFWSDMAAAYWPEFKVASLEDGLKFAFEVSPRKCLELNGGRMPFGCHAWARYDRKFWEPFLVSDDDGGFGNAAT